GSDEAQSPTNVPEYEPLRFSVRQRAALQHNFKLLLQLNVRWCAIILIIEPRCSRLSRDLVQKHTVFCKEGLLDFFDSPHVSLLVERLAICFSILSSRSQVW